MILKDNEYYLMHKDIPVCLMEISEEGTLSRAAFQEGKDVWKKVNRGRFL